MDKNTLNDLMTTIALSRYVNLSFSIDNPEDGTRQNGTHVLEKISNATKQIITQIDNWRNPAECYITLDANDFPEGEEEVGNYFLEKINEALPDNMFDLEVKDSLFMKNTLVELNNSLKRPGLIVFYLFFDPESEKEKHLLRGIREFIEIKESAKLGILIVSIGPIEDWILEPSSPLDGRDVQLFSYNYPDSI